MSSLILEASAWAVKTLTNHKQDKTFIIAYEV
jgi:hypothetical protein